MTFIILSLLITYLLILEVESQQFCIPGISACQASGRLETLMVLVYRGKGRLGCYRASERD